MSTKHKTHRFKYTVNDVCLAKDGSLFYAADIDGTLHRRSISKKEKASSRFIKSPYDV